MSTNVSTLPHIIPKPAIVNPPHVNDAINAALHAQLQEQGQALFDLLDAIGRSREVSLAKTKLEECVMWAEKALRA